MSDSEINEKTRAELMVHVDRDHERLSGFVSRILTMRAAVAALAATISAAAIGVTISERIQAPAIGAAIATVVLGAIDLSYSAHYRVLRSQARHLERALNANFKYLYRSAGKAHSAALLQRTLADIELGQVSSLSRLNIKGAWAARDARTLIFVVLAILAVIAAVVTSSDSTNGPFCFAGTDDALLMADDVPQIIEGELHLVACE